VVLGTGEAETRRITVQGKHGQKTKLVRPISANKLGVLGYTYFPHYVEGMGRRIVAQGRLR
jgi:hypothetical protein